MLRLFADHRHVEIRAEMRALQMGTRIPIPAVLIGLLAAAGAASTFVTLSSL
jgi:hypothetical protein